MADQAEILEGVISSNEPGTKNIFAPMIQFSDLRSFL
jgi:hypothetical protein